MDLSPTTDFDQRALDKIKEKDILMIENKADLPKVVSREKYPDHIECIEICAHQRNDTKKIISLIADHLRQGLIATHQHNRQCQASKVARTLIIST